jgi:hypothetical protein
MSLDNFIVRPKRRFVEKFQDKEAWEQLTPEAGAELAEHVAGLPSALVDDDLAAKQFDYLILLTQLAILGYPRKAGQFGVGHVLYGTKFNHEFSHPAEDRPTWDFGRKAASFATPFGTTPKRAFAKWPVKPGYPRAVCIG